MTGIQSETILESQKKCFILEEKNVSCSSFLRVMESLNLLRYLVIRDKVTENQVSAAVGPALSRLQSCRKYNLSQQQQLLKRWKRTFENSQITVTSVRSI